jgi:hypothetical protein
MGRNPLSFLALRGKDVAMEENRGNGLLPRRTNFLKTMIREKALGAKGVGFP